MDQHITLATFTPAEVERITGLSTNSQRDWRRREFLPATPGHARFDPFAVAEIWTLKLLTDRGIGPQVGKDVAAYCANAIVFQALQGTDGYEGDHLRTLDWNAEAPLERDPVRITLPSGEVIEAPDTDWPRKRDWLLQRIFYVRPDAPEDVKNKWFVWWADGSHGLQPDLQTAFSGSHLDPKYSGAAIILDIAALGWRLLDLVEKALVKVKYPEDMSDFHPD